MNRDSNATPASQQVDLEEAIEMSQRVRQFHNTSLLPTNLSKIAEMIDDQPDETNKSEFVQGVLLKMAYQENEDGELVYNRKGVDLIFRHAATMKKDADRIQAQQHGHLSSSRQPDEEDNEEDDDGQDEMDSEDSELEEIDAEIRDIPSRSPEREVDSIIIIAQSFKTPVALLRSNGLLESIRTVCVDQMKWEATNITDWRANLLEIIGKSLSYSTLNGVFEAIKIFQSLVKTMEPETAYRNFTVDTVGIEQLRLAMEYLRVRRLTLEHEQNVQFRNAEMVSRYNSLWKEWDAAYKSVSAKPKVWLERALTKARLTDEHSIIANRTCVNNRVAARVFQFYLSRKAENHTTSWKIWTATLTRELQRARVINSFVSYNEAFIVLLPFHNYVRK